MRKSTAFTLIEVLLVVTLIGVIMIPLYISYTKTQANQGLRSTTEQLSDALTQAHIFAREARDKKAWGVKRVSDNAYSIISGNPSSFTTLQTKSAEKFVSFPNDFSVWFEIGTGDTASEQEISVQNKDGITRKLKVTKTGLVEEIAP